ncbi:MAG: hypothetical protein U1F35_05430 [Steroidobacteraceae bacterium]
MARASPIITSLNAGEFSKDLDGRVDISRYPAALQRAENFLLTVQGPAQRRGGTRYLAATKASGKALYVKFEFSAKQSLQLEFGDLYVRFDTQHGFVEASPGVPYEIVSPYAVADLWNDDGTPALYVEQSGDVLYIANQKGTYAPQTLTRLANNNWVFAEYAPNQGPFQDRNTTTTTIYASAGTGSINLVASAAVFVSTDVGRLVRLELQNFNDPAWETGVAYTSGDRVRWDGKTYKASTSGTSGIQPPTHEHDDALDGKTGVKWTYQDPGYGVARITAYTDSTHVAATVIVDTFNGLNVMPAGVVGSGNPTKRWRLGAWSVTTGYPRVFVFFKQRLFAFTRLGVYGSVPSDFANHSPDFFGQVRQDNAINATLQDANDILWAAATKVMLIGTGGGEFIAGPLTSAEPMGPSNFGIDRQSRLRVKPVPPTLSGNSVLFTQASGRKLFSLDYQVASDNFVSQDLAVLSNRITASGIIATAYQAEPHSMLWLVLANGKLISFTYDKEQEVWGWGRHPIGGDGFVESAIVTPSPDGTREELYLIVRRTINGATVRYKEFMERPYEAPDEDGTGGDDQADCFYVDAGLTYQGVATSHVSNLSHLEGQTVQVLGDGAVLPDCVVSAGAIDIARACSTINIGLQCGANRHHADRGGRGGWHRAGQDQAHPPAHRALHRFAGRVRGPEGQAARLGFQPQALNAHGDPGADLQRRQGCDLPRRIRDRWPGGDRARPSPCP